MCRTLAASRGPDVSARVRRRVQEQQAESEILVGWVQLGIVLFLGGLYAVSPKTVPADRIAPVPWAVAGYLSFTLLRLADAHRRVLPGWLTTLSCIVDVGLLLVLIWTFHWQYAQPAAFVLKAPTLFYVFIFIALRALLLEPRQATITGLTAAVGWLVVVGAVIVSDTRSGLVTRDYVEYLTSSRLLVGAEVDKVVAIVLVTVLIALAMRRARTFLLRSIAEEARARDLARFFSPAVAEQITAGEIELVPGRGEEREAAILYVDIRDFTGLALALKPDQLIGLLADYQARLIPPILANGGTSEKFLGDGMMAAFGAVVRRDAYAADALRAAEGILESVDAWNRELVDSGRPWLDVRVAVTAGRVAAGAVGGETRLEYAVVGHPVNLAAKLEKHAKVEHARALCTRDALDRAMDQGFVPAVLPRVCAGRSVAGVTEPLDLVVLASA